MRLDAPPYASGFKPEFKHGFVYSDCRVDDARLVICNAMDAFRRGARVLVHTECTSARWETSGFCRVHTQRLRLALLVGACNLQIE